MKCVYKADEALEANRCLQHQSIDVSIHDHVAMNDVATAQPLLQVNLYQDNNDLHHVVCFHPLFVEQDHFVARWQDCPLFGPGLCPDLPDSQVLWLLPVSSVGEGELPEDLVWEAVSFQFLRVVFPDEFSFASSF